MLFFLRIPDLSRPKLHLTEVRYAHRSTPDVPNQSAIHAVRNPRQRSGQYAIVEHLQPLVLAILMTGSLARVVTDLSIAIPSPSCLVDADTTLLPASSSQSLIYSWALAADEC
ncbi:hypothetical protein N7478_012632 [Penicillium angulare]|uniref:uncharacterized protein n=1 Tax=Penicillium angulare TaxID=116970 RepID=UPI002540BD01|nr:uncharacterized protein N7478_012632 [Penicillium angulare]KAJ5256528.1 hypothetical protein N7478_012632 [Penicillium angulare]